MKSSYSRQVPIFSHSDNSSLQPHQSTASGDGDGKHRQSLCSSFSDRQKKPDTGTSIVGWFFVHLIKAVNHICYFLMRDRFHTCILIQGKRSPSTQRSFLIICIYKCNISLYRELCPFSNVITLQDKVNYSKNH